jgi:GNAT superfamily N-acetyltransferase
MDKSLELLPISQVLQFSDQPLAWSLKLWATGKEEFSEQDWHNFYANTKKSDYQNWDLAGTDQELLFLAMVNVAGKAFVVREDLRGSGVGTQVLQLMERKVVEYGISHIYLWTEGQRAFYQNRGYQFVEQLIKKDRIIDVMEKSLSS